MSFIFQSDAGIMLIFHLQTRIWEFYFPFTCNRHGKCFGISVTHLTSKLEIPGSSPGVSNNFFSSFFVSFWPFTVPSPLIIKTLRFANNVINNRIYLLITPFFHLIHYFLRVIPMGDDFFFKSGFDIPVFCEQYRHYFCLDLVDFLVCCSWDYRLSKSFLNFSIRYQDHAHDHDHYHHDHHYHMW